MEKEITFLTFAKTPNMRHYCILLSFGFFMNLFSMRTNAQDVPVEYIKLKTYSNDKHIGKILQKDNQKIVIETLEGSKIEFPTNIIKETTPIDSNKIRKGQYWFENVNRYKYLIGSTAVPLKKKHGYVQLLQLGVLYTQVGLTDHLSIGGGALLWGAFNGGGPHLLCATIKYSGKVGQKWYAGAELQSAGTDIQFNALSTTPNKILLIGRALATYTGFRFNATGSAGYGMIRRQDRLFSTGDPIVEVNYNGLHNLVYSLNCGVRVSPRFSLVLENILYPRYRYYYSSQSTISTKTHYSLFQSFGFNITGEHLLFGIGAAYELDAYSLLLGASPYIDLAYKFGNNK